MRRSTDPVPDPCLSHQRKLAVGRQLVAAAGGTAVLPHDRGAVGLARATVPRQYRLALIGDADGGDVAFADAADHVGKRGSDCFPDLDRVVLDPAGLGVVLRELAVGSDDRVATAGEDRAAAHAGRAGIDRDHTAGCGAHYLRRLGCGLRFVLDVRPVGAGLGRPDGAGVRPTCLGGAAAACALICFNVLRWYPNLASTAPRAT